MKSKRRLGVAFIVVGVLLLAAALLLLLHNQQESRQAGVSAEEALLAIQEAIREGNVHPGSAPVPTASEVPSPETEPEMKAEPGPEAEQKADTKPEMDTKPDTENKSKPGTGSKSETEEEAEPIPDLTVINGHEYVGYLEIPSLDRTLPIMKLKYLQDLQTSPCLQFGSPWANDAVIAAHNYASHFGPLRDMTGGETIIFTDMNGESITYTVEVVQTIAPTALETVKESPYDLVLYTCTTGGKARVMIGCNRAE